MTVRKVVNWAVVIFLAYFVLTQPHFAGQVVGNTINGIKAGFGSIATFLTSI